jgi:hypothetical protein
MGVFDFLTEGTPSVAQPYASTQQNVLPDWYTNYAMDILANQRAVADRPFALPPHPSTRIADFSALQTQAFEQTPQAAKAYEPYMAQAGRSAADVTQQFMNPYTDQVVNRIGELGTRTLQEQVLPGISDQMTRAGQFGGTRQAELMGRAIRDAMGEISAQQTGALQQGYSQSLTAAQREQERQGALASQAQQLGLTGVGALQTAGALQQGQVQRNLDLAEADRREQFAYPQEQIGALTKTLAAYPNAKKFVWVQEEPRNMGAYRFAQAQLKELMGIDVDYVGRPDSASPAVGSQKQHAIEQDKILSQAIGAAKAGDGPAGGPANKDGAKDGTKEKSAQK